MSYLLYSGCTVPARLNAYELAVRRILKVLGVDLIDFKEANCCGLPARGFSMKMQTAMATRVLSLAEKEGLNILVLCNGCLSSLAKTKKLLKEDEKLRSEVDRILSEVGLEFKGSVEVKHLVHVLHTDAGVEKIASFVSRPFSNLKFAVQYGCHLLYPSDVIAFENPEFPTSLDKLVECTGAKSERYKGKNRCCGAPLLPFDEKIAYSMGREKIMNTSAVEVDGIVTVCPFCHIMLESVQLVKERRRELPIILYPQLLGLAMGFGVKSLGLNLLKISCEPILEKLG